MIAPSFRFVRTACLALAVALALPALASAQAPAPGNPAEAKRFLEQRHEAVLRVLRRPARDEAARERRRTEIVRLLADLLDYQELSRRALGNEWNARSEAERREFVDLLKQLVERSYQGNLERTADYQVRYGNAEAGSDGVVVRTTARSRRNRRAPEVAIDYSLRKTGSTWKVFDVSTDGVSMVRNYRNQFRRIIQREGWSGLISRMRSRLSTGEPM